MINLQQKLLKSTSTAKVEADSFPAADFTAFIHATLAGLPNDRVNNTGAVCSL